MSRMRKRNKKQESIKSIISGLLLSLIIGMLGSVGSYAYFTSKAEFKNDLEITMGNLDVDLSDPINMHLDKENNNIKQIFKIKNNGTLKQHVSLKFSNFNNNDDVLSNINSNLIMKYNGKSVKLENYRIDKLSDLSNMSFTNLVYQNGKRVELEPEGTINCQLNIDISNSDKNSIQDKNITFDTEVDSIQIGALGGSK